MHRNRHVTRNCFWPRGFDFNEFPRLVHQLIAHVVHETLNRLHNYFLIRKCRQTHRAPINHPLAAIDVALLEEIDEHLEHRGRIMRVHRELRTTPIGRGAQRL